MHEITTTGSIENDRTAVKAQWAFRQTCNAVSPNAPRAPFSSKIVYPPGLFLFQDSRWGAYRGVRCEPRVLQPQRNFAHLPVNKSNNVAFRHIRKPLHKVRLAKVRAASSRSPHTCNLVIRSDDFSFCGLSIWQSVSFRDDRGGLQSRLDR
jgi:hypothetical protein